MRAKVRRISSMITTEHMRVSWEKAYRSSILRFLTSFSTTRLQTVRRIRLARPPDAAHPDDLIDTLLLFHGPSEQLATCSSLILSIPGGGFVSMSPDCHRDYLSHWAKQTGAAILSINYRKAPDYPYPYAIHECFAAYRTIVETQGRCL